MRFKLYLEKYYFSTPILPPSKIEIIDDKNTNTHAESLKTFITKSQQVYKRLRFKSPLNF